MLPGRTACAKAGALTARTTIGRVPVLESMLQGVSWAAVSPFACRGDETFLARARQSQRILTNANTMG